MAVSQEQVAADTRRWLERAVIGLNLCPFARAVHVKGQIRLRVSDAQDDAAVLEHLEQELGLLAAADPQQVDTTLLVVPGCLQDFLEFNELLGRADRLVRKGGLEGVIQLASFHPHYVFAGTDEGDVTNCSNRSPYPILHLLREASIARAVQAFPDASAIYETNMATLRALGAEGWDALGVGAAP